MINLYYIEDKVCTLRNRVTGEESEFTIESPNGQGVFELDINWIYDDSYVDGSGKISTPYNEAQIVLRFIYSSHFMALEELLKADEIDIPYSFDLKNDNTESFILLNREAVINFFNNLPIQAHSGDEEYPYGEVVLEFGSVEPKTREEILSISYYGEAVDRPNTPTNVSVTVTSSTIFVNWDDNSDEVDQYQIHYREKSTGLIRRQTESISEGNITDFKDGEIYDIWVTASRDGIQSEKSTVITVETLSDGPVAIIVDRNHPMSEDLVLYLNFHEGSGNLVEDISNSQNKHNASIVNPELGVWTQVDGKDVWQKPSETETYLEIEDHLDIDIPDGQNFSIGIFFNLTEDNSDWNLILGKGYPAGYEIWQAGWNETWQFNIADNGPNLSITPSIKNDSIIHQLVAVYDQSVNPRTIDVYADGVFIDQITYDDSWTSASDVPLRLPGSFSDGTAQTNTISYHKVGFWNRKISAQEISDWYNNPDIMLKEPATASGPTGLQLIPGDTIINASVNTYPLAVESYNWYLDGSLIQSTTGTSYTFTGLTNGQEYTITATVTINGEESGHSTPRMTSPFEQIVPPDTRLFRIRYGDIRSEVLDASVVIVDSTPPVVSDGSLSHSGVTTKSFTVSFEEATDNITPQNRLSYSLYTSTSDNLNTDPSTVESNGTLRSSGVGVNQLKADGLDDDTLYYYNIVVADEQNNKSIYSSNSVTTNEIDPTLLGDWNNEGVSLVGSEVLSWLDSVGDIFLKPPTDTVRPEWISGNWIKPSVADMLVGSGIDIMLDDFQISILVDLGNYSINWNPIVTLAGAGSDWNKEGGLEIRGHEDNNHVAASLGDTLIGVIEHHQEIAVLTVRHRSSDDYIEFIYDDGVNARVSATNTIAGSSVLSTRLAFNVRLTTGGNQTYTGNDVPIRAIRLYNTSGTDSDRDSRINEMLTLFGGEQGGEPGGDDDGSGGGEPGVGDKVMPTGDSITQATGYREALWNLVLGNDQSIDFVGSQGQGAFADDQHEGHGGWYISHISDEIESWISEHNPDFILLMIGTNDIAWWNARTVEQTASDHDALVGKIIAYDPTITLLVASIPPQLDVDANGDPYVVPPNNYLRSQYVEDVNAIIESNVNTRKSNGDDIHFVDVHGAMNPSTHLSSDSIHPNAQGYATIGLAFFNVLSPLLSGEPPAPTVPDAPTGVTAIGDDVEEVINVSWNSVPGADSYTVYYTKDGGSPVSQGGLTSTTYTITEFDLGSTYVIWVTATNNVGESDESSHHEVTNSEPSPGSPEIDTSHSMAQDLIMYLNFHEGQGTTINDISGSTNKHDGTINNPSNGAWSTLGGESVWSKNANDDATITIPHHDDFGIADGQNFTIGMFFSLESTGNFDWVQIFNKGYPSGYSLNSASWNNDWSFSIADNGQLMATSAIKNDGTIHSMVAVFGQDTLPRTIDVYIDGAHVVQLTYDDRWTSYGTSDLILSGGTNPNQLFWNKFAFWRRKLSAQEISDWNNNKDIMLK